MALARRDWWLVGFVGGMAQGAMAMLSLERGIEPWPVDTILGASVGASAAVWALCVAKNALFRLGERSLDRGEAAVVGRDALDALLGQEDEELQAQLRREGFPG